MYFYEYWVWPSTLIQKQLVGGLWVLILNSLFIKNIHDTTALMLELAGKVYVGASFLLKKFTHLNYLN